VRRKNAVAADDAVMFTSTVAGCRELSAMMRVVMTENVDTFPVDEISFTYFVVYACGTER
jgi:hypothetical protein